MQEYPQQLMLFTEVFPASNSHSVWQETRKGRTIPVISGQNFRGWSEKLDRVGLWLKTYLASSASRRTKFAPTWSVRATKSGYGIMKLRLSERCTDGKECFLWRTPDAHCYRGASSKERYSMKVKQGLPISLNDQVAHLLPTPTANDAKNNGNPSRAKRHSLGLNGVAGGSLNPNWVEALMGFPQDWTA